MSEESVRNVFRLCGGLAIVWSLVETNRIQSSFYPRIPSDQVTVRLQMPAGTPFEATDSHIRRMEKIALDYKEKVNEEYGTEMIRNVFATAGGQPMYRSYGTRAVGVAELGEVVIELTPFEVHGFNYGSSEATAFLREAIGPIPDAERLSLGFLRGGGSGVYLRFTSPSFNDLRAASSQLQDKLEEYRGLAEITDSFESAKAEFELQLKPQAEYLGITASNLARQVRQAFFGTEAQRIQRAQRCTSDGPLSRGAEKSLATLDSMMIRTPTERKCRSTRWPRSSQARVCRPSIGSIACAN